MKTPNSRARNGVRFLRCGWAAGLWTSVACGLALFLFGLVGVANAQKAKKSSGGGGSGNGQATPVTSTLSDSTNSASYQLESDGNGPYLNYSSGKDSVSSIIQASSYDWVLDTKNSTSRSVSIALVPDSSNNPNSPFSGPITLPTRFIVKCHLVVSNSFLGIVPGGSVDCLMSTTFIYGGNNYQLLMNSATVSGTNDVHVTCTGGDSSGVCNAWKITPQPGAGYNVGRLALQQTVKGKTTFVSIGYYDVNFSFMVTNP